MDTTVLFVILGTLAVLATLWVITYLIIAVGHIGLGIVNIVRRMFGYPSIDG